MTVHEFDNKLKEGEEGEAFLDDYFRERGYDIRPASDAEQRQGIDRWMKRAAPDSKWFPVEYKTDAVASRTGNAFVETVSVDTSGKRGWAYTSRSDWLIYYVPGDDIIYIIDFVALRLELPRWEHSYITRPAQNNGYRTYGVLVPLHEFEKLAARVWPA